MNLSFVSKGLIVLTSVATLHQMFSLFALSSSRKLESIVDKYKDQLAKDPSPEKEEQAILWSLAELARQVDKSVTAEEVETEIGDKINEILERVEIADAVLRKEFNMMRLEFSMTKTAVNQLIESAKTQIVEDMNTFKKQLIESLQSLVSTSSAAQQNWQENSETNIKDTMQKLQKTSLMRSIIFFVCFQILLVFGLIFYNKLQRQLLILL